MPDQELTISRLVVSNILGIKDLDLKLGKFTEISGKNGSGKTSVLESIKGALKGGNDATLLRNGEKKGEIVLILDDDTRIIKSVSAKGNKVDVIQDKEKVAKAQTVIDSLYDMLSVNPINFLTASKKDRTKALLEVLPLELPLAQIREIITGIGVQPPKLDIHPLESIQAVHSQVFDERTGINRVLKEKDATMSQLQEGLVEIDFDADELAAKITQLQAKREQQQAKKTEYAQKINDEKASSLDALNLKFVQEKAEIEDTHKIKMQSLQEQFEQNYNPVIEELTKLSTKLESVGGIKKQKEMISQFRDEVSHLTTESAKLSRAIERLDELKLGMIKNLPIQGLEVKDGEIFRDGIAFDRLNTAQQVKIAVEVAKLRAGDLKLICVDGLEKLDSEAYEVFKQEMIESGLQLIVTRVTDTELQINSEVTNG